MPKNCYYIYEGVTYSEAAIKELFKSGLSGVKFSVSTIEQLDMINDPIFESLLTDEGSWINTTFYKNFPKLKERLKYSYAIANSKHWGYNNRNGITLYLDAIPGTAYHEAWHEFNRFFLSKEEQKSLYKEVIKNLPAFKNHDIKNRIDVIEIEEVLANSFMDYMLSDGEDILKGHPIRNTTFRKILNYLKALLGLKKDRSTIEERLEDLYKNLRTGIEDRYIFNLEEDYLNEINHITLSREKKLESFSSLAITKTNSIDAMEKVLDFFDDTIAQVILNKYTVEDIFKHKKLKIQAYAAVKNLLEQLINKYKDSETKSVKDKVELYQYIVNNFDDFVEEHGKSGRVDLTQYDNTKFDKFSIENEKYLENQFEEAEELDDEEQESEDEEVHQGRDLTNVDKQYDSKDVAAAQVRFIVSSLRKVQKNGELKRNKYGFIELVDFEKTWNFLSNELSNIEDYNMMLQKLEVLSKNHLELKQLLLTLPNPKKVNFTDSEEQLVNRFRSDMMRYKRVIWINSLEINRDISGELSGISYKYLRASNIALKNVKEAFKVDWAETKDSFSKIVDLEKELNLEAILETFTNKESIAYKNIFTNTTQSKEKIKEIYHNRLDFLKAFGFVFSDVVKTNKKFEEFILGDAFYLINYLIKESKKIVQFNKEEKELTETSKGIKLQEEDKHYIKITDPLNFFSKDIVYKHTGQKDKSFGRANSTRIDEMLSWEINLSGNYYNNSSFNAALKQQYENTLYNTLSMYVQSLNDTVKYPTYQALIANPELQNFDVNKNPYIRDSLFLNSLFDLEPGKNFGQRKRVLIDKEGKSRDKLEYVTIDIQDYNGMAFKDNESTIKSYIGKNTVDLTSLDRSVLNVISVLKTGTSEIMRMADKSTAVALTLNFKYIGQKNRGNNKLFFDYFGDNTLATISLDTLHTDTDVANKEDFKNLNVIFKGYLKNELERIYKAKRLIKEGTSEIVDLEKKLTKFNLFNQLLSEEKKQELLSKIDAIVDHEEKYEYDTVLGQLLEDWISNESRPEELQEDILKTLGSYLEDMVSKYKKGLADNGYLNGTIQNIIDPGKKSTEDQLIRAFILNRFVLNIEESKLIFGDFAMFKDPFKRLPLYAATGSMGNTSKSFFNRLNKHKNYRLFQKSRTGKAAPSFDGEVSVTVVNDVIVKSNTIKNWEKVFDKLIKDNPSSSFKEDVEKMRSLYDNNNEADGQGFVNFDFYRLFKISIGFWYDKHEVAYQKMIELDTLKRKTNKNKEDLKELEILQKEVVSNLYLFPPIKLSHGGPIKDNDFYLPNYLKFSVYPLLPGLHTTDSNIETLIDKMFQSNTDILSFSSGSKVMHKGKKGKLQNLYEDIDKRQIISEPFYNFKTYLKYYKEQLQIEPKNELETIFGTQVRKLFFANKFVGKVPIDFKLEENDSKQNRRDAWYGMTKEERIQASEIYFQYTNYLKSMDNIVKIEMENLAEELGIELLYTEKGNINYDSVVVENFEKLIDLFVKEAKKKKAPKSLENFLKLDKNGKLLYPIEASKDKKLIQDILLSIINNRLVKQKVNGQSLVQVAQTGNEFKFGKKNYSDTLDFYKPINKKDGTVEIEPMQVIVSFNSNYSSLLSLKSPVDGETIKTVERLNLAMQDADWYKSNKKLFILMGYRIPTQGTNSIAYMKIKQFSSASSMNTIVLPSEITTQAGSDFDIDKMTVIRPYIKNGKIIKPVKDRKSKVQILQEIEDLKKVIANTKEVKRSFSEDLSIVLDKMESSPENLTVEELLNYRYNQLKNENTIFYIESKLSDLENSLETSEDVINILDEITLTSTELLEALELKDKIDKVNNVYSSLEEGTKNSIESAADVYKKSFKKIHILYENLEDLKEHAFQQKKANTNVILEITSNMLKRSDTLFNLIYPNSTDLLHNDDNTGLADIIKDSLTNTGKENFLKISNDTSAFDPSSVEEIYKSFIGGKDTLGIAALQPPLTQLLQAIGAYTNTTSSLNKKSYLNIMHLDAKRIKIKVGEEEKIVFDMSDSHDSTGKFLKSNVFSQFINAYVDIAKEPFIFYMNADKKVAPIIMYLTHIGVPLDQTAYFINQPIIRSYIKKLNATNSMVNKVMLEINKEKYTKIDAMVEAYNEYVEDEKFKIKRTKFSTISGNPDLSKLYRYAEVMLKNIEEKKDAEFVKGIFNTENLKETITTGVSNPFHQRMILLQFLMAEVQSASLREVTDILKPDTRPLKSITASAMQTEKLRMFSSPFSDSILPGSVVRDLALNTEISPFIEVAPFMTAMWDKVELLQSNPLVKRALQEILFDPGTKQSHREQDRLIKEYLNDILMFMVQNKGIVTTDKENEKVYVRDNDEFWPSILKNKDEIEKNINTKYLALREKYDGVKNKKLEDISEIFKYIKPNASFYTNLFTMKWTGISLKANMLDKLSEDWRYYANLQNPKFQDIRDFYRELARVAFLSYGELRSKDSFFSIVPSEIHAEFIMPYITHFIKELEDRDSPFYEMFSIKFNELFKENNPQFFVGNARAISDKRFKDYRIDVFIDGVGEDYYTYAYEDAPILERKTIKKRKDEDNTQEDDEISEAFNAQLEEKFQELGLTEESSEPEIIENIIESPSLEEIEEEDEEGKFATKAVNNVREALKKDYYTDIIVESSRKIYEEFNVNSPQDIDELTSEEVYQLIDKLCSL